MNEQEISRLITLRSHEYKTAAFLVFGWNGVCIMYRKRLQKDNKTVPVHAIASLLKLVQW